MAYAVGLITTDGNLSRDGRHISLTSVDRQLLSTFKRCLGKDNMITPNPPSSISRKPAYRVQFGDVALYSWLERIGLTPNKSLTIGELKIPNKYFKDFLRGHLDGDGSLIHFVDRYNTKISPKYIYTRFFVYFRSASRKHILWLRHRISKIKGVNGSLATLNSNSLKSNSQITVLKFSTKEAKIVVNWIYYKPSLPFLKRKYQIARPFLKSRVLRHPSLVNPHHLGAGLTFGTN